MTAMPIFDFDNDAMRKLVRGPRQRAWIEDLLDDGVLEFKDYLGPTGHIPNNGWSQLIRVVKRLEDAGYLVEVSWPSHPKSFVNGRIILEGFDPWVNRLTTALYGLCSADDYYLSDGPDWPMARRKAIELRAELESPIDVEIAIGLLPSWSLEDARQGFPELLAAIPHLRATVPASIS